MMKRGCARVHVCWKIYDPWKALAVCTVINDGTSREVDYGHLLERIEGKIGRRFYDTDRKSVV